MHASTMAAHGIWRRVIPAAALAAVLAVAARPASGGPPDADDDMPAPEAVAVRGALVAPAPGVAELRFGDMFERPVGPRGLRPTPRLLWLDGKAVRIVGYMAAAGSPMAGRLVLAPMPVDLGDEDEHLADDLPPSAVFVHLTGPAATRMLPNYTGLIGLTGRLSVGPLDEPDGHVSAVRLLLDAAASQALLPRLAGTGAAVSAR